MVLGKWGPQLHPGFVQVTLALLPQFREGRVQPSFLFVLGVRSVLWRSWPLSPSSPAPRASCATDLATMHLERLQGRGRSSQPCLQSSHLCCHTNRL